MNIFHMNQATVESAALSFFLIAAKGTLGGLPRRLRQPEGRSLFLPILYH